MRSRHAPKVRRSRADFKHAGGVTAHGEVCGDAGSTLAAALQPLSQQGIWLDMFKALSGDASLFGAASIDSSHVKAHRSAAASGAVCCRAAGVARAGRQSTGDWRPLLRSAARWRDCSPEYGPTTAKGGVRRSHRPLARGAFDHDPRASLSH
jgi:hypothetical protein